MRLDALILLTACLFPVSAAAESPRDSEDGCVTHLDHLAFAFDDLRSAKSEVRHQGISRLVLYKDDSVANGILLEHWFAETDHSNRLEILHGLLRNGALSEDVIADFRRSAARFTPLERDLRLQELEDVRQVKP